MRKEVSLVTSATLLISVPASLAHIHTVPGLREPLIHHCHWEAAASSLGSTRNNMAVLSAFGLESKCLICVIM